MPAATPAQTVGPFFTLGLCDRPAHELVPRGSAGAVELVGRVLDGAGEGVPDALVEIWGADAAGDYGAGRWGRSGTSDTGEFAFLTEKPGVVPGDDGAAQAPHLTVLVFARGLLKPVHTRVYFPDETEANEADPVLAALDPADRGLLVAVSEGARLRFDVRLQGAAQTPFFAL